MVSLALFLDALVKFQASSSCKLRVSVCLRERSNLCCSCNRIWPRAGGRAENTSSDFEIQGAEKHAKAKNLMATRKQSSDGEERERR